MLIVTPSPTFQPLRHLDLRSEGSKSAHQHTATTSQHQLYENEPYAKKVTTRTIIQPTLRDPPSKPSSCDNQARANEESIHHTKSRPKTLPHGACWIRTWKLSLDEILCCFDIPYYVLQLNYTCSFFSSFMFAYYNDFMYIPLTKSHLRYNCCCFILCASPLNRYWYLSTTYI